jgi:hypothetical protein
MNSRGGTALKRLSLLFIFILTFSLLSVYSVEAQIDSDGDGVDDSIDPNPYSAGTFDFVGYFYPVCATGDAACQNRREMYQDFLRGILIWVVFFALFTVLLEQTPAKDVTNQNVKYILSGGLAAAIVIMGWKWIKPIMLIIFGPGAIVLALALLAIVGFWIYESYSKARAGGLKAGAQAAAASETYAEAVKEERAAKARVRTEEAALKEIETEARSLLSASKSIEIDIEQWFKELKGWLASGVALSGTQGNRFRQQMTKIASVISAGPFAEMYRKAEPIKHIKASLKKYEKYTKVDAYKVRADGAAWENARNAQARLDTAIKRHHGDPRWVASLVGPGKRFANKAEFDKQYLRLAKTLRELSAKIRDNEKKLIDIDNDLDPLLANYETHVKSLRGNLMASNIQASLDDLEEVYKVVKKIDVYLVDIEKLVVYADSLERKFLANLFKEKQTLAEIEDAVSGYQMHKV